MKKLRMMESNFLTLEDGCNKYLDNCRARNLREGTINHYRQSYLQFYKFFGKDMKVSDIDESEYQKYVVWLRTTLHNDVSINAYLRDFITTMHFLMNEGYLPFFRMQAIKVDRTAVETYSEEELYTLLKKPNIKKCSFTEYQSWVMTNFLFSTAVRQRSLMNIRIKDLDFENNLVNVTVTKNRKSLIVPFNDTLGHILKEFLKYRQYKTTDDFLFCNAFGQQLVKSTCYYMLYNYNKRRGVETTGIHRYRHTFAKQWILNGGNVVSLSKILGHSSLQITQNYVNLLVSEVSKEVAAINLLDKFSEKKKITMENRKR
ncbi:MAG: site-specific integrase [Ruminococcaceae bacterium]|nr:site-specific integrase [Oscillospiraceae bacterium]